MMQKPLAISKCYGWKDLQTGLVRHRICLRASVRRSIAWFVCGQSVCPSVSLSLSPCDGPLRLFRQQADDASSCPIEHALNFLP